ncbi:hypothetical protein A2356_00750 [Candidatus Nomurabacteria bacterium RIFOXYB1_FULL_39_16]|uniref:Peptidoglycan binding-like domain-containing protein n=2 Tax=Candidatus Nomuraibacteriota TaxID=1752729 RepID=A0A0G0T9E8_9BACT|nr:MAG: hypothetical protein UT78_C0002G0030 [Candidatus Nomurabacteria bacterium GW2011_GWF2_40_12]OGJ09366.1 MAG: hypothetical protein A2356_00750 [Candidatus Nomurabacteria bacterium RIFOXYB1_FULL_39_16]OGJ14534.1 MAG: hypothetical protein A2585_02860 [Candidatus Nomurabacteria bacterium RIFOXYD1_FULL_39_12]
MKKKIYFLVGVIMVLIVSALVFNVKNTQAANPKESPIQLVLSPDSPSEINVKKGDKLKYNITLNNSGGYSGKVSVTLMDVPPGVNATLKMDSDSISSGGTIKGTLDLDIVGRVPSGKNRVVLSFAPSDYTFCDAYDITCVWRADLMNSKIFYLNGTDLNYTNSDMPTVINSVIPSILKRVKLVVSDFRRENPGFSHMDIVYGRTPFLVADEMIGIYCNGQENCQAGDVDYEQWYATKIDLSDPLNPQKAERGAMINQADRVFGHGVRPTSLGMSRDGNLSFITWLRGDLFMASKSPYIAKTLISDPAGETELSPTGDFIIADSSSDTFLIRSIYKNDPGNRFEKVSDFKTSGDIFIPDSIPTNVPQIADYGTPTAVIRALDGESPDYVAVLGNGGKNTPQIALGGKDYKLSDLSIYSLEKKSALGMTNLSGLESLDAESAIIYGFETPTGKYAFAAAREKAPSSPMSEYNRIMWESKRTFYLYGLDEAGKKLIPIIGKGLISEGGDIKSVVPIHVSGKDFLAVFISTPNAAGSSVYTPKILVYSFDDLKTGKVRNIADASISSMKQILRATSLIKNGETYMYTIDEHGAFLVWKFDKNSFSSSGAISNAPSNYNGGVPFYPTYPTAVEDPNCPGGTVYQTSAGSLCVNSSGGVTTTTSYNFNPPTAPRSPTPPIINNLDDTILKKGSTGEEVRELQVFLNNKLNTNLVEDGKMGPNTVAAVKRFQVENNLKSDGVVGPKTREVMNAVAD